MTKPSEKTAGEAAVALSEKSPTEVAKRHEPAVAGRLDTASLDIEALASSILAREIRPRVADVRRLAEAVLRMKKKKKKKKAKKDRKQNGGGTERKLSKIPARVSEK